MLELDPEVRAVVEDPERFVSRLEIANESNELQPLDPLRDEQLPWIRAILGPKKYVLGLKPRQVGYTTIAAAVLFAFLYASRHPKRCLSVVHDDDTLTRVREMTDGFMAGLPSLLRHGWSKNNDKQSVFAHNGAMFERRVAGGRGKGRGGTRVYMHATEMAHWPTATAASSRDEAGASDEEMFASAMASLHAPESKVIIESTGNGPRGVFHELWQQAASGDPRWAYVFVPWNQCRSYVEAVPDPAALEADLDDEELELVREEGLALEQIAWRRTKIRTERWNALRFKREFPLSDMDPFQSVSSGWFDQQRLARALRRAPIYNEAEQFRVFHEYDPRRRYYMGVDTAGGTRKDEACIQVVDDNLVQCAVWASDSADPIEQALMVSRIGGMYHRPLCKIEANKFGMRVIARVEDFGGVTLWKNPETGKDFWTTGGRAGDTKREACVYARTVIDHGWTSILDRRTIFQLQNIVLKSDGKIEGAAGSHDDRAMAYIFALSAAREAHPGHLPAGLQTEIDRLRERLLPGFDPGEAAAERDRLRQIERRFNARR